MAFARVDFRYVEIEYELWALGHFLELIEPQIRYLQEQDKLRTFAELHENGGEPDEAEVQLAYQELDEKQQYVIPRFMRGPFIVSLWACFEAGVIELANGRQREMGAKLALSDLRGDGTLKRARRYFEAVLDLPLDQDEARYSRLSDLYLIRNSLAHANGQRQGMKSSDWKALSEALSRQGAPPDEDRGFVILSDAYLRRAYDDVKGCVGELVLRIRGPRRR